VEEQAVFSRLAIDKKPSGKISRTAFSFLEKEEETQRSSNQIFKKTIEIIKTIEITHLTLIFSFTTIARN